MYEEQDRRGDVAGVQPGGVATPGDRPGLASRLCPPGYVWLGDLSGWEIAPSMEPSTRERCVTIAHRCGWDELQRPCGMNEGGTYVGNLVERLLELVETHQCAPYVPSEEHKARVQRWTDSSSGGAQAGLLITGPMTPVDLMTEGQRLFRQGRHAEAEIPLAREILGDEAAEQPAARQRCCPTCYTPADDDGVQREHHIQCAQKEPANIPVRRRIDGKWQTIEITLSEWRAVEGDDGREPFRVVEGEIRAGDAGGDD